MPKLQLSVLKVVGTHNFDAQKVQQIPQKVRQSSGCGNDESDPLTEMQF